MKCHLGLLALFFVEATAAQKAKPQGPTPVELVCGKLIQVDPVLLNGVPAGNQTERTPIRNTKVRLYRPDAHERCCKKQLLAAESVTDKDGAFEFSGIQPGNYWLAVRRDWADYTTAINYDPSEHTGDRCSELSYELSSEHLRLAKRKEYVLH